jgi:hypothetical protein
MAKYRPLRSWKYIHSGEAIFFESFPFGLFQQTDYTTPHTFITQSGLYQDDTLILSCIDKQVSRD